MKQNVDHHGYIEWIEKLGLRYLPVEDWRKRRTNDEYLKNDREYSRNYSRKCYGSASAWISFTETIFFTQNRWNTSPGASGILRTAPFSLFIGKMGRRLPPSLPRRKQPSSKKSFWKAQFKISKLLFAPPILISSPPSFVIYRKVTGAYRTWFSSFFYSFSHILSEIFLFRVMGILRKHYGCLGSLGNPFFNKTGEVGAT